MKSAEVPSLARLDRVELDPHHRALLASAESRNLGGPAWAARKRREMQDVLAMAQLARRMEVGWLDAAGELRIVLRMRVPVPRVPDAGGGLRTADAAVIGLRYAEEGLFRPQPGAFFLQVLEPGDVFHPNVRRDPPHLLCLGETLPAGIRCKDLLLMAYGALSLAAVMIDEREGVMNLEAARFFQLNQHLIPLSREPFLPEEPTHARDAR